MIFLTGGTGFIGSKVLEKLSKNNEQVCILTRQKINPLNTNTIITNANLTKSQQFSEYIKKSDVLVHIAGCAKAFSKDKNEFYNINYLATKILIDEALKYNLKKIIYISTCMVFGPSDTELCENNFKNRDNFLTDYEKSKYLAEIYVRKKIKEGAPIIILYPTRVFGPGRLTQGNSLTKLILYFVKSKIFPVIESSKYYGNYVYIDDVVNLILKAIYEIKPPETLLVAGYNLNFQQFFQTLNNLLSYNGKVITIKKIFAMQLARFFENLEIETGIPAPISRGWIQTFATNWLYSNEKVKNLLHYEFVLFETALRNTLKWLQNKAD